MVSGQAQRPNVQGFYGGRSRTQRQPHQLQSLDIGDYVAATVTGSCRRPKYADMASVVKLLMGAESVQSRCPSEPDRRQHEQRCNTWKSISQGVKVSCPYSSCCF